MNKANLKKILKKSKEEFNVDCASCSNYNGRECGRINLNLKLTHEAYKDIFGQEVYRKLIKVSNLPMDRKEAIKQVVNAT